MPLDGTELGSAGSDGLGMTPRPGEPESNLVPGMAAPRPEIAPLDAMALVGPLVPPNFPDTSIQAPQPPGQNAQEPPRWQYDFDPAGGLARATFPGEVSFSSGGPVTPSVTSFNTRTGAVTLLQSDLVGLGIVAGIASQSFTASGTYTPNPKMIFCVIEAWGSGGGGGGTGSAAAATASGGGGGGAGSYSKAFATAATIGASQAVTIGAAGTAGASGPNAGGNGGDCSLGVLCVGKGGAGGSPPTPGTGGAGGIAGTGNMLHGVGQPGGGYNSGNQSQSVSNYGGSAMPVGAGGQALNVQGNGNPGTGFASGGAGGLSLNAGGAQAGGVGTAGLVTVTEYLGP